ncbi:MAG TPA: ATP-binding protein [Kofleriaceae bacterium]|jgi:signal transduction histidine kinase
MSGQTLSQPKLVRSPTQSVPIKLPRDGSKPQRVITHRYQTPHVPTNNDTQTSVGDTRREQILADMALRLRRSTDRMFLWLLLGQWLFAVVLAMIITPFDYTATGRHLHFHVWIAFGFGAVINVFPTILILTRPGWWLTRHANAVSQMLWSGVLIAITGGRVETHFHIFASLGVLALYRDWKVLPTATGVVVVDHLLRGVLWPDSVYGVGNPEWWVFFEHVAWILVMDVVLIVAVIRGSSEMKRAAGREARLERINATIEATIGQRTTELKESTSRYRDLVENTAAVAFEYDVAREAIVYIAPQAARLFDCGVEQLANQRFLESMIHPDDRVSLFGELIARGAKERPWSDPLDFRIVTLAQRIVHVRVFLSVTSDQRVRAIALDVTRQRQLETDLQHAQKLESVGRLAAGVAHEINTPIQFIGDSVVFMASAITDVVDVLEKQGEVVKRALALNPDDALANAAVAAANAADLEYIVAEAPKAGERARDGVDRVSTIVRSMKVFAHPDSAEMEPVDLNHALTTTLTIARNEYRYIADLDVNLGELPPVTCFVGEVNQAILNIIVNASHAIADAHQVSGNRGKITVTTTAGDDWAEISIRDTGGGIPDHVRDRVFDPFFTTKDVGKGTGQGLSIARSIIVDRHHGSLRFETERGNGTTFFLRLPLDASARARMQQEAA